jgi:hypothetical protein
MLNKNLKMIAVLSMASLLTACGGGGAGGGGAFGDQQFGALVSGNFIDSPVAGLHYEGEQSSGDTAAGGAFNCRLGETIIFSVGDLVLGSASCAADNIFPTDLTGEDDSNLAIADKAQVMALILHSLDEDGDSSNGISIPSGASVLVDSISLSDSDANILAFVNQLRTDMGNASLYTASTAQNAQIANVGDLATAKSDMAAHLGDSIADASTPSVQDTFGGKIMDFEGVSVTLNAAFDGQSSSFHPSDSQAGEENCMQTFSFYSANQTVLLSLDSASAADPACSAFTNVNYNYTINADGVTIDLDDGNGSVTSMSIQ